MAWGGRAVVAAVMAPVEGKNANKMVTKSLSGSQTGPGAFSGLLGIPKTGSQPGSNLRGLGAFSGLLYHKIVCCRSKSEATRRARRGVCPEKLRKKFEFFHIEIPKKPPNPSVTRSDFWSFWHFCPPRVP